MESPELYKEDKSEGFGIGKHKKNGPKNEPFKYFVKRVANKTGFRRVDVEVVLKCLTEVFEECLVESYEVPDKKFFFGPIEIVGKKYNKNCEWKNPQTGEIVKIRPHVVPTVRLRPFWRDSFSVTRAERRKSMGYDINGEPLD